MQTAYQYLYEIENTLRQIAKERLSEAYGPNWQSSAAIVNKRIPKDFDNLNFHDLISWYRVYPPLINVFPQSFVSELNLLVPIRNKIAHCHPLNHSEFLKLQKAYHFIVNQTLKNL